ncbi:SPW repeat protein [Corynebacterium lubricantis]|uniref:SPW repeat protein n=1 Tax=Corynebacterium lubricantis TaxID=541095 RepID=UPI000374BB4B|nr:SPW repeat protein [Corynebacterium lubricantis]
MTAPTAPNTSYAASNTAADLAQWKTWPDWINLVLGAYLALAALWTTGPTGWGAWPVTLGIVVAAVALWALATASSPASEWVQIIVGAVAFLAPWFGGFAASTGAAWTMWIVGAAVIVFGIVGLVQSPAKKAAL